MKNLLLILALFVGNSFAETIASYSGSEGYSYNRNVGAFVNKDNFGWTEDRISKGKVSVTLNEENEFDILFVDALGDINSSKDQGAKISLQIIGDNSFSLVSIFLGQSVEIYSFWKDNEANLKYSIGTTKGELNLISKNSLLVGKCSNIEFGWLRNLMSK